jgi:hypothetical protein
MRISTYAFWYMSVLSLSVTGSSLYTSVSSQRPFGFTSDYTLDVYSRCDLYYTMSETSLRIRHHVVITELLDSIFNVG